MNNIKITDTELKTYSRKETLKSRTTKSRCYRLYQFGDIIIIINFIMWLQYIFGAQHMQLTCATYMQHVT